MPHPKDIAMMEVMAKFSPQMLEQYRTSAAAHQAVNALVNGADVYKVLEITLRQNEELTKQLVSLKAPQGPHSLKF